MATAATPTSKQTKEAQPTGIVAVGAYIPLFRLPRSAIAQAWGARSLGGERSVANYDEDSVTMAVEAARDCLNGIDRSTIGGLYFASTTAPYHEKGCATLIAAALNLPSDILTADFAHSLRSGTSALLAAMAAVDSGQAKQILVVAADSRIGYPKSTNEQLFGDAAAAVLIGKGKVRATIDAFATHADELHDVWRRDTDPFVRSWEDRWVIEQGYTANMRETIGSLMKREGIEAKEIARAALYSPNPRGGQAVARALGLDPNTQLQDSLIGSVGACGAAQALLLLVAALEEARAGDRLLVASYGDGADALLLNATTQVRRGRKGRGVNGHLASKRTLSTYEMYATFRGLLPLQPEPRLRVFEYSGSTITWRLRNSILKLHGSRCNKCGTTIFPIQRICYRCRAKDDYTEVSLADEPAKIFTFSLDNLAGGLNPPVVKGVVESDEGQARIDCLMTDCEPEEIRVDLPMEMTFRRMHEGADMHNYYWKARPVRNGNGASSG